MPTTHSFDRYADIMLALGDPHLVPLPAAETGPPGSLAWLRANVARFSSGEDHARRRAAVEADLALLAPGEAARAYALDPRRDDERLRVVRALARCLGLADPHGVALAVRTVAAAYFGTADAEAERAADAAVAWLLPHVGGEGERAANRIGLLVQGCEATATLIDHARRATTAHPDTATLLEDTLRRNPPVRQLRRTAVRPTRVAGVEVGAGDLVLLDVVAAHGRPDAGVEEHRPDPLTFGAAPRLCPGRAQAMALATAALQPAPPESGAAVAGMVDHVLSLAATWTAWDGKPVPAGDRVYTPHKAIRRVADHLTDHLAELEARLAGEPTEPDHWHASATTTPADLAPFTPDDLDEARSRLTRLARIWSHRLGALTPAQLDDSPGGGWTFRHLALHVSDSVYYAEAVGDLSATPNMTTTEGLPA
ncbi:hypothetical protein [Streptacidiphilus sp. EB129]|uniref:hypothetical protein n=1 Tax=Streptacidiphilus sp. EB129 TaxID=3156262 RepID=UPI003515F596